MSLYKQKFNPLSKSFNLVPTNTAIRVRDTVASQANLPLTGNTIGDGRVTTDTGHLYIWSIDASSGLLTDWIDQGNFVDVDWSAISNKPSSSVSNIDDAISKKHSHTNQAALDNVSGTNTGDQDISGKEDVSNKDTTTTLGTSDTKYPSQKAVKTYVDALGISTNTIRDLTLNIMLNAFRIAQQGSLAILKMIDQFVDEYEDETGVDTVNSTNESYDSSDDFYTPSTDSYTKLLLHLDNNVTDVVGKTVTNNNVTFSSDVKKFGTHAAVFNGSTAYLTVPDSDDWNFGSGDFTIDCWVYRTESAPQAIFGQSDGTLNNQVFLTIEGDKLRFGCMSAGTSIISPPDGLYGSTTLSINTWYHIALVRNGNVFSLYVDGVLDASWTGSVTLPNLSTLLYIGVGYDVGTFYPLKGYIDEFRWSKGIARWTENFSVPTVPYTIKYNMTLLSNAQIAEAAPTSARLVLFEEDVDAITLNTDIKGYVSRDNGTTYSQVTLEDCGNYVSGAQILQGVVDISAQPSGTNMKYKVETLNNKNLKLHGAAISWK